MAILVTGGAGYIGSVTVDVLHANGETDLSNPAETSAANAMNEVRPMDNGQAEFQDGIQQVRSEYRVLDDRLGRIERWLPEQQGDAMPRLATEDRLQVAVGNLTQEFDVIRTRDRQVFMQVIYAAEQTARQRDVSLSQAIEILNAEYNPRVKQR